MLTLEKLKEMAPNTCIRKIETNNLRYIAMRGSIHDWAIYYGPITWDYDTIKSNGDKLRSELTIKDLVPCNDEAFAIYRY